MIKGGWYKNLIAAQQPPDVTLPQRDLALFRTLIRMPLNYGKIILHYPMFMFLIFGVWYRRIDLCAPHQPPM